MIVERILLAARKRLIAIGDDAPLIAAKRHLRDLDANLVVVHDRDGVLARVITKTDIVRQISPCAGASCMAAASAVMTKVVDVISGRSKSDI
jgi:CBS domain-containing protein